MRNAALCCLVIMGVVLSGCSEVNRQQQALYDELQPVAIKSTMRQVADWQLENPSRHGLTDWTYGALYTGMFAWSQMADSDKYDQAMQQWGDKARWRTGRRTYHADDYCVGQTYIDLYEKHRNRRMIRATKENLDHILANQPTSALKMESEGRQDRWNWCDALFMGPPVWAKMARLTGDDKYLDYMNKEWWATTDYLYDEDEHLYYRDSRYFDRREQNDEKIFWSRGNGWVFAGLARVIDELPADYPDRDRYIDLYREMAAKLIAIQPDEGLWHSSLLDPVSYPTVEASGSGFYCYGLAWGINKGLLDEAVYLGPVVKAWTALTRCVHPDGKLGYVQPIGADPRQVRADQTEIYGVGAFLLAGSEVYKIAVRKGQRVTELTVVNPGQFFRDSETISADKAAGLSIFDLQTNQLLCTQDLDGTLLFQTDLAPGQKKSFWLMKKPASLKEPTSEIITYCRFVPDRKDDFAWENDKVCYRMYGPALEYETITCGIDAWGKCVPYPVFDKMIKAYNEEGIPYHENHGEGGDFYKVGPTLGCGGMAPFVDDTVRLSPHNYSDWKIVANGPIRSIFELRYEPWQAGPYTVRETKRISLDLGSNFSRIECHYDTDDADALPLAAGIILRDTSDKTWSADEMIAYWLPADYNAGHMGCGVIFGDDYNTSRTRADAHLLLTLTQDISEPVVYYAGSCWDANEPFSTFEKWQAYMENYKKCLDMPVTVKQETLR